MGSDSTCWLPSRNWERSPPQASQWDAPPFAFDVHEATSEEEELALPGTVLPWGGCTSLWDPEVWWAWGGGGGNTTSTIQPLELHRQLLQLLTTLLLPVLS